MKIIVFIALYHIVLLNMFALGTQEDEYIGLSDNELIDILGGEYTSTEKNIELGYTGYESEPDYSQFFSREELELGIIVKVLVWEKKQKKTIVWFKFKNERWTSFSSLSYNTDWVNF